MAHHDEGTEKLEVSHEDRLLLIKSPVVGGSQLGSHASSITPPANPNMESLGFGDRIDHTTPEFLRVGSDLDTSCDCGANCAD